MLNEQIIKICKTLADKNVSSLVLVSVYHPSNHLRVVQAVDKLHACIYDVPRHRLLHASVIPLGYSSFYRIVNEIQVANLESMINRVFIHIGLNNPDGHFCHLGMSQLGNEFCNTSQDVLPLDQFPIF